MKTTTWLMTVLVRRHDAERVVPRGAASRISRHGRPNSADQYGNELYQASPPDIVRRYSAYTAP